MILLLEHIQNRRALQFQYSELLWNNPVHSTHYCVFFLSTFCVFKTLGLYFISLEHFVNQNLKKKQKKCKYMNEWICSKSTSFSLLLVNGLGKINSRLMQKSSWVGKTTFQHFLDPFSSCMKMMMEITYCIDWIGYWLDC